MSARVAILGLGHRGARWVETCLAAGWDVHGFDPDDRAGFEISGGASWRREKTISGAVAGADWVVCCLPERLELICAVVRRAQASAKDAVIAVASQTYDVDSVQSCAIRPGHVFRLLEGPAGELALDVSPQNDAKMRSIATEALAVLSAAQSVGSSADEAHVLPETREA